MNDFSPEQWTQKEKQTQFHTLNSDECILWQSKRKDESRGKKYHFPGRCRNEKKEPNRLDYRTDFRDVSRLFLHHFAPSFLRKICDFCSIDNIFSIFGAKTDVQKATTLLSPLPPFRALCIITNSVERWVCMWIGTARRPAFHASSFPKSLIFRMVFVLQMRNLCFF